MSSLVIPRYAPSKPYTSIWSSTVISPDGLVKWLCDPSLNMRPNIGADWQAAAMEGHANKGESGAATSTTATSLTKTGATFPTANSPAGYRGHIIACGPNSSGTGSTVYGICTINTATVITVDKWRDAATPDTAGTTPNGTCNFQVLPGQAPAWYMALSTTVQSGASGDTTLAGEITTATDSGLDRHFYTTLSHTAGTSSYSLANTFTATTTQTINSEALFNSDWDGVVTDRGVLCFENSEPNAPTLVSGDTLAQTVSVSY